MSNLPKAILVPPSFSAAASAVLLETAEQRGQAMRSLRLPVDPEARIADAELEHVVAAYFGNEAAYGYGRSFFSAVRKAPNLQWLHAFNAGVDHPVFLELRERGVRITTSVGTTALPVARSALTGLLMLARGFPHWLEAQRQRRWDLLPPARFPQDLDQQTLCILGLGHIGSELARLALGLGLSVIGIRRSPRTGADPVDELYSPDMLAEVLPRCQWLAVTCPLNEQTRGLVDRDMLSSLPRGACLINVGRGGIVDEAALTELLQNGHLGGAYLDVFDKEPLPESSPLWALPNVILTPHQAGVSRGNEERVLEVFFDNLERWLDGQPLHNEVNK